MCFFQNILGMEIVFSLKKVKASLELSLQVHFSGEYSFIMCSG